MTTRPISKCLSLFDWPETKWLLKARRSEFVMILGSFLGIFFVGILEGIAIAVALSLANFVRKALHTDHVKQRNGWLPGPSVDVFNPFP